MADQEKLSYAEKDKKRKEIGQVISDLSPEDTEEVLSPVLSRYSRRDFLVRSGQLGLAAGAAVAVAGGIGGFIAGKGSGADEERGRLFPKGELLPDLREKLEGGLYLVVDVDKWTAESLRENGVAVPELPIIATDEDPETTLSIYEWLAVGPNGIYLPREADDTVSDLTSDISTANRATGAFDNRLKFVEGMYSDFLEAEIASLRDRGLSIFQTGHVAMNHRIEIEGVSTGFAIGRLTPADAVSIITFDATREAPLPPGISAGGFVVAK